MHIPGGLWITRSTCPQGRVRERRIRFRDAVPVGRDRRELRRRFRQVNRAVRSELRAETAAELQRLSADRVLLSGLIPSTRDMDAIIEFADGTQLLVGLFSAKAEMERLGLQAARCPIWLVHVQPCFGYRRFWLWLASADRAVPLEVLASVQPLAMAQPDERGGRR